MSDRKEIGRMADEEREKINEEVERLFKKLMLKMERQGEFV
jgi:hypothetical protein